ncbi:MAG: ASPIC/UnbV domain-containing protein [Acidobacteriota bacterium]
MSAVAHIDEFKTGRYFRAESRGTLSWNGYENNVLLQNQGTDNDGIPQFLDVGMATGADDILDSRGLALADFDNDGDLDIAINHNEGDVGGEDGVPVTLLRNDLGNDRNWLAVELVGAATSDTAGGAGEASNRDGIGSLVRIESGNMRQLRVVKAGSSYASQSSGRVYFGLGDLTAVDSLTVSWPSGRQQRFAAVAPGQVIRIREGVDEVEVVRD